MPAAYRGMDRFAARLKVVGDIEALGLLEKIEPSTQQVPHGDRSGVPVEPWLTDQWYVKADMLAEPVIKAVEQGTTKFVPPNWDKTYFEWMRNIQPWCVSRQLWWGHQIPAWYGPKWINDTQLRLSSNDTAVETFCATSETDVLAQMHQYYRGRKIEIVENRKKAETCSMSERSADRRSSPFGATPTSSTPGSRRPCGRSPRSAGPRKHRNSSAITRPPCSSRASTSSSSGWPG